MKKYTRVSYEERCQIFALIQVNKSQAEISRILGRSKSTISRELRRMTAYNPSYLPKLAQELRDIQKRRQRRNKLITGELEDLIVKKLKERWSPELIAGRLNREKVAKISHQSVYNYIFKNRPLVPYLKFGTKRGCGRRAQRRQNKEKYTSIHKRPKSVLNRNRYGHWESDGMYAGNRQQLLVCQERKSRYILVEPIGKVSSEKVNLMTKRMLKNQKVLSITNDNGSEFRKLMNWDIPVYHCDPLRPDQRGSIENVIGTMRLYITRKTDLNALGMKGIKEVERKINLRPRKMFDYQTPYEIYFKEKVALVS